MKLELNEIGIILTADKPAKGQLSSHARAAVIGAVAGGKSQAEVARAFGVSKNTVSTTVRRFVEHRTLEDLPGRGRPSLLTKKDRRYLI
jgi:transposase